jgi:hypothetical protein
MFQEEAPIGGIAMARWGTITKDSPNTLEHGMVMYDALYTWCRSLQAETHDWPPASGQQAHRG